MHQRIDIPVLAVLFTLGLLAGACAEGGGIVTPEGPRIEIIGVEEGGEYAEPVTIQIDVQPAAATYSVRLNGDSFHSGTTIDRPGQYVLRVEAAHAGQQAVEEVAFSIALAGEGVLILRMIELGPHVPWGGGGDAILLTDSSSAGMMHGMVDAGPGGFDENAIDYDHVAERLVEMGVDTLEFLQLTHAHADHYAGMQTILDRVHVRRFLYNGQVRSLAGYRNVLTRAEQRADSVMVVMSEWEYTLGTGDGATRMVHIPGLPDYLDEDTNDGRMLNEGSLGTFVERGGARIFLTGDGENRANDRWRTEFSRYTADLDVLKVGHHGANNAIFDDRTGSTSQASSWLEHTRPRVSLITANGVSHPRQRALDRLLGRSNTETYCTHVHGTVEVRFGDDGRYHITVERNADRDCVPGSDADS